MKQRPRIYYSEAQKAIMWDRWRRGETLHHIAQLFDRGHSSIHGILSESGGIRPPAKVRSRLALSSAEREEISRGVVACRWFPFATDHPSGLPPATTMGSPIACRYSSSPIACTDRSFASSSSISERSPGPGVPCANEL